MNLLSTPLDGVPGSYGEIILDPPSPMADCRVSNLTSFSAAITIPDGIAVPDAFTLAIAGEFVMRRCHVVWRRGGRVGVAFEMPT